jgi:predicted CXXCH cytochrome family protein
MIGRRLAGGLMIVVGVALALLVGPHARGGVPAGAKHVGAKLCTACHRATHAKQVSGYAASAHPRALWKIEEADDTHKVMADFAKGAPFSRDQVAYVVGSGQRYQAYLSREMKVLPGEWVVKSKSWRPREAVDATKDCLGCHTTGYDPETAKWTDLGAGCEACHGPGSVHAGSADKKSTIVRLLDLDPARQAMVCARCHALGKSKDGRFPFPVGFMPGDDLDQAFTYTQDLPQGAMGTQYNELRFGGGKHLASGVVCTTCHDPHGSGAGATMLLREPVNQLCLNEKCHGGGKLTGAQHSKETLQAVTCAACHMPGGKHLFVPPQT